MKVITGIILGLFSGFLLMLMTNFLFMNVKSGEPPTGLGFLVFIIGWGVSAYLLQRNAANVSRVFTRGFLLGAAEWFVMPLAGLIFSSRISSSLSEAANGDPAASAGVALGGGLMTIITGGFSLFMVVVCLIGFAISHFIGKEMQDKTSIPTRQCPFCAEMVQKEATICRHCRSNLPPP